MVSSTVRTTPPTNQYKDSAQGTVKPIHRDIRGIIHSIILLDWAAWEFLAASLSSIPFSLVMTESLVFWEMSIITTWLPADSRATRNAPM